MTSKLHLVEDQFTKPGAEGRGHLINRVARAVHDNALLKGATLAVGAAILFNAIVPASAQVDVDYRSDMGRYQQIDEISAKVLWEADAALEATDTSNTHMGRYQNLDGPTPEQLWDADVTLDGISPEQAARKARILQVGEDLFEYMRIVRGISSEPPSVGYSWTMAGKVDELMKLSAVSVSDEWAPEHEAKLVVMETETNGFRRFSQQQSLNRVADDYHRLTGHSSFVEVENIQEHQALFAGLRVQIEDRMQAGGMDTAETLQLKNLDSALAALQTRDRILEDDVAWIPWMAGKAGLVMEAAGHDPAIDDNDSLKL